MNNRGMALGTKVILVSILLLIVFIAVAGSFGFGFKKVFDQAKQLLGFPSEQLEELRNITTKPPSGVEKIKKEGETGRQFLVDAANYIKDKNYDDAVKKYVEYYKDCEKGQWTARGACGAIEKKGVKFRILNALREKYFVKPDQDINQDDLEIVPSGLITLKEFNCAMTLSKSAAYTHSEMFDKADGFLKNYGRLGCMADKYYDATRFYFKCKKIGSLCISASKAFNNLISSTNSKLSAFENAPGPWEKEVDFDASKYEFLKTPYNDIKPS